MTEFSLRTVVSQAVRCFALLVTVLAVLLQTSVDAQTNPAGLPKGNQLVKTEIIFDHASAQPSHSPEKPVARVGVRFVIEPGWHIYWKNPGEAAFPTQVTWKAKEGWEIRNFRWPAPYRFIEKGDVVTFGYRDEVMLIADLVAPSFEGADFEYSAVPVTAHLSWLVCKESCVPGEADVSAILPFGSTQPVGPSEWYSHFERFDATTPIDISTVAGRQGFHNPRLKPFVAGAVRRGEQVQAGLELHGFPLPLGSAAAESVQLFHEENPDFEVGRPKLAPGADVPTITFELKAGKEIPLGEHQLNGIIVLSCTACGTERDLSVAWSIPIRAHEAGKSSDISETPLDLSPDGVDLTFRRHTMEEDSAVPVSQDSGSFYAVVAAFLAGILLNIMPCVLPVLSLKVFGFVENSQTRAHAVRSALVFATGVISTFLVLAAAVVSLKGLGAQIGWGFQFQHLGFVFALTFVVFLFSLGFFGLYTFNPPGLQIANQYANRYQGRLIAKHFLDGVLATLLSTPCTAPFLGTALAFAFVQPGWKTFLIFAAIGAGLATPYVLLASNEKLLRKLPKPGAWMDTAKQILGFFLLATVLWLLFVMQSLHPSSILPTLALLLISFFIVWLKRELQHTHGLERFARGLAIASFGIIGATALQTYAMVNAAETAESTQLVDGDVVPWSMFSAEAVETAQRKGETVLIDFTADWCITCKFNERFVLGSDSGRAVLKEFGITAIKADWTSRDAAVTAALKRYGGQGVPHYVVISPVRDEPEILPTLLTTSMLRDAFSRARQSDAR